MGCMGNNSCLFCLLKRIDGKPILWPGI